MAAESNADAGSVRNAIRWGLLLAAVGTAGFRLPRLVNEYRAWREALAVGDSSSVEGWRTVLMVDLSQCAGCTGNRSRVFYALRPKVKATDVIYQLGWTTLPGLRGLSVSEFRATPTNAPDNERGVAIEFANDAERDEFLKQLEGTLRRAAFYERGRRVRFGESLRAGVRGETIGIACRGGACRALRLQRES